MDNKEFLKLKYPTISKIVDTPDRTISSIEEALRAHDEIASFCDYITNITPSDEGVMINPCRDKGGDQQFVDTVAKAFNSPFAIYTSNNFTPVMKSLVLMVAEVKLQLVAYEHEHEDDVFAYRTLEQQAGISCRILDIFKNIIDNKAVRNNKVCRTIKAKFPGATGEVEFRKCRAHVTITTKNTVYEQTLTVPRRLINIDNLDAFESILASYGFIISYYDVHENRRTYSKYNTLLEGQKRSKEEFEEQEEGVCQ